MSSAELSTASINVAPRGSFALHCRETQSRSRVCKSLFGPVDHEELKRDLDSKLREISELDQKRWNFNFAAGSPLDGDYEWEEASAEASPAFYQECVRGRRSRVSGACVRASEERENAGERDSHNGHGPLLTASKGAGKVRRSPNTGRITDFYVRRYTVGMKRTECETTAHSEQTPRKRIR